MRVLSVCGGNPMGPQIGSLERGVHIVVGTPGRVLKHLTKETILAAEMKTLVLDEADRMLDMGFSEDIEKIIGFASKATDAFVFSDISRRHLEDQFTDSKKAGPCGCHGNRCAR